MKTHLVRIGNSRGLRLPKALIEEYHLENEVDLLPKRGEIVIKSSCKPRSAWATAFQEMKKNGDDRLVDSNLPETRWALSEWQW